jgi:hypothetical protein
MSQGRGMGEQVGGLGEHDYIRELWGNQEGLGGTKRDLGEYCICYGSVMLELALDLFQNYYQTAFCSL